MEKHLIRHFVILLAMIASMAISGTGFCQMPFDFSDDFYRKNGIDPDKLMGRITADEVKGVSDTTPDADHNNVRNIEITGGFNAFGNVIYYSVFGMVTPETFTPDAAGLDAMVIGNQFHVFIFPLKDGDPLSPEFPNRRQDNIFDTRGGYFEKDPLGNWSLIFVSYTEAATNTPFGKRNLRALAKRNGRDLDGTPVIKRASEIEDFAGKGLIQLQERVSGDKDNTGARVFPWVICPAIQDPGDGAITADAFLVTTGVSPEVQENFDCLQSTGKLCEE